METIQSLEDKIFNLLNENRPKEIQKPKKKKVQESSYERELLQSLQMINEDKFGRFSLSKEQATMLFQGAEANLATRLQAIAKFVKSVESVDISPRQSILIIDIINNIKGILDKYDNTSAGFEMEYLIAALCGGEVIPVSQGNEIGDITDVRSGNDTAYSIKTVVESKVAGSGTNFARTLQAATLGGVEEIKDYTAFYYIILEKEAASLKGDQKITFKQIEIVGPGKSINFDNIKSMYGNKPEVNKALDEYESDRLDFEKLKNVLSRDGSKARSLSGINTSKATPIGELDLRQIQNAIERNSNQFIKRIQDIRELLKVAEENMQEYIKVGLDPEQTEKANSHLEIAKKTTINVSTKIAGQMKAEGK